MHALIRAGADLNSQDEDGYTPLHHTALMQENDSQTYDAIRTLVEAGADLSVKNNGGRNPIEYARYRQEPKIAAFMESLRKDKDPKPSSDPMPHKYRNDLMPK